MKSDLRKSQLNRRLHLSQNEYLDRSKKIQINIVESEIFHEANLIACYLPIKNEVDTSYIIKSCFDLNKLIGFIIIWIAVAIYLHDLSREKISN